MADKNKLGKGLGAIFGEDVSSLLEEIQHGTNDAFQGTKALLKVDSISVNPYQPRRHFDEEKLNELAESIRQHGLFTPILVRGSTHGYQLIAGERRLRASKLAHLEDIPAIVVDFDDHQMMEIAIIENVQREDLNVIEEAQGYQKLADALELTQDEIATRVNKSRTYITNVLRLLKLPESVQGMVLEGKLTMGQVRPLITLDDTKLIESIAKRIVKEKLSARQVEQLLKEKKHPSKPSAETKTDYSYAAKLFERKLQTKIEINERQITIRYNGDEDLNRILESLGLLEDE